MERAETLRVAGMHCAEEVSLLRSELSRLPGILDLSFDVLHSKLTVRFDPSQTDLAAIRSSIQSLGMSSEVWQSGAAAKLTFWERRGRLVMTSISGTALLGGIIDNAIASHNPILAFLTQGEAGAAQTGWLRLLLYAVALISGSWLSLPKAWRSLRGLRADMNVLLIVSVAGAIGLGQYWTVLGGSNSEFPLLRRLAAGVLEHD